MRVLLVLLTLLVALTGCAPTRSAASADLGPADGAAEPDTLQLALGEETDALGVALRFVAVEEDSRCPAHTTCVWQGRARIQVLVADEPTVLTLDSGGDPAEASATHAGVRVTLASLDPYPGTDETGRAPVATLIVDADAAP